MEKYYVIHYKARDYGKIKDEWYHCYATSAEAAEAALRADPLAPKVLEIVDILEQGFDIGDRVVVKNHEIVDDEPGVVIGYAFDGLLIVEWEQFDYAEEVHWTELEKVAD